MSALLKSEVESAFSGIIKRYRLIIREITENEVALIAASYAIGISLNRDGLSFMYYDLTQKKGFNLGLFLINKRRELLTFDSSDKSDRPLPEYLRHNLEAFVRHLTSAGTDILKGDKAWIKQYSWPTVNAASGVF